MNSFDEKLTAVLQNYQEQVDKIAPVQVGGGRLNRTAVKTVKTAVSVYLTAVRKSRNLDPLFIETY